MSAIFIATGTCTMGMTKTDKGGNVVSHTPAQFTFDDTGGSVAIGELDSETMKPKGPVTGIYADWDAAGYLEMVLELLKPRRTLNIPDIRTMIVTAAREGDGLCRYCTSGPGCRDCIIREWEEEAKE